MGRIVAMRAERDGLRLLVDRLVLERTTAIQQRDDALKAIEVRDVKLYEWKQHTDDLKAWADHRDQAEGWAEPVLWGVSGVGVGIVVGVLVCVFGGGG